MTKDVRRNSWGGKGIQISGHSTDGHGNVFGMLVRKESLVRKCKISLCLSARF